MVFFAMLDLALSGIRATMGRDGRIAKRDLVARGLFVGIVTGVIAVAALGAMTAVTLWLCEDGASVYDELVVIGQRMLVVFAAFAALVVAALAVYGVSRHEIRTFATVAILGPFTLARPWVVVGATLWGLLAARTPAGAVLAMASSATIIALDRYLDRRFDREVRWTRQRGAKSLDAPPSERGDEGVRSRP